ncbi:Protein translocase subunit SecD, partial [hydrothermal vent metagenome]
MGKQLRNRILIIIGIIAVSFYCSFPPQEKINLGLDLKGGMHLILKVDTEELDDNAKSDAVLRAIEILRNRIDSIGVGETVIQRQGENQILVQLPGITDRDAAIAMIGRVAQLEFRLVNDQASVVSEALKGNIPKGYILKTTKDDKKEPILLEKNIAMNGENISDARVDFDSTGFGQPYISLSFDSVGSKKFAKLTKSNVGRRLAIIMDGEVLSAPNINEAIMGGTAQITGQFTFDEASLLALSLRSGALPAPMHIEEERTIGPLLGKDSITAGITATIIGGTLVILFMLLYYLQAGLISDIALVLNLFFIFGMMGFLNIMLPESQLTLTLPGIAGIILTLGMAVDANVLINERIREEMDNGRPLKAAVNSGFDKALKAIVDSNTTTLIAAFMLFQFGSGPIKGFAVTLSIGLIVSLFTALFVTRTIFNTLIHFKLLKKLSMLRIFANTNFDFVSKRFICFFISTVLIIGSIVVLVQKKEAAYGIDFVGGQIQEYHFNEAININTLRSAFQKKGINDVVIQQFDEAPENIILRSSDDTDDKVVEVFSESFPNNTFDILRIEKVGPVVGKSLRKAAVLAIIFALGG